MNEIRKNTEQEEELVIAKLKMPWGHKLCYWLFIIIFGLYSFIGLVLFSEEETGSGLLISGLVLQITTITIFRLHLSAVKQSSCVVTNKRIKGIKSVFFTKKAYSYRLDEIDNIEVQSNVFGKHELSLHFCQGYDAPKEIGFSNNSGFSHGNTFITNNIANYKEVFEKMSALLCERKNEKDLQIDIEMEKIAAEKSKAEVLSSLIVNMGNIEKANQTDNDYISQLTKIKELFDAGVITQEEFNAKKKQLLGL